MEAKKQGRPFKFTPQELLQRFEDYVEYNKTQYFTRQELIKTGEKADEVVDVKIPAPLTVMGFCLFIETPHRTFLDYVDGNSPNIDDSLTQVATYIRDYIQNKQIQGASLGVYQHNIIARLVGLTDKQEVTHKADSIKIELNGSEVDLSK